MRAIRAAGAWLRARPRARIAVFAALFLPSAWLGAHALHATWSAQYRIGLDMQRVGCLPWQGYLIALQPYKPTVARGDILMFSHDLEVFHRQFPGVKSVAKLVAGLPGDQVEVRDDQLFINGVYWDRLWLLGFLEQPAGAFDRAYVVPEGHYFMAGTAPGSYDSRYWGPITQAQVTGYVRPLF